MKPPLEISEEQVAKALTVRRSIQLARHGYLKLAKNQVLEPLRTWFTVPGGSSFYFMPAYVLGLRTVSIKVVSVNHRNPKRDLPSTVAMIFVFNSRTGEEVAVVAGNALTAIRTAASSALATDILARKDADSLGIIGTGPQAQAHLSAILAVRNFSRVMVYSRSKTHRDQFVRKFSQRTKIPIIVASSAGQVAHESEVLVLATGSAVPLFKGSMVQSGSHVNAIGSSLPNIREMDTSLVRRSILVVDSRKQALGTYGDIITPLREGAIRKSHIRAELGELLLHHTSLRKRGKDITVFKAGGLGVLDAIFADYIVSRTQHWRQL